MIPLQLIASAYSQVPIGFTSMKYDVFTGGGELLKKLESVSTRLPNQKDDKDYRFFFSQGISLSTHHDESSVHVMVDNILNKSFVVIVTLFFVLTGYSKSPQEYFKSNQSGASADYGIFYDGNLDDHVVTVHGFLDGRSVCKEVVKMLKNLNSYRLIRGKVVTIINNTFVANNLYRLPSTYA